ncbi:tetratricopeptide repeat domain 36 [Nesidiocoris tenuis]|uniref:Tetratricopeptide repeat domain 36 n=1 Tax=Nesidiocoris tenuis TaxID=355587 RepID=A0ABN7AW85_9HEMI|nr:tetratricopeptide repeat domain 36 [Nesidiocoris tenuis]
MSELDNDHDKNVLNSIFNPFLPIGEPFYDEELFVVPEDKEQETPEVLIAKRLELEGVNAAEGGDFEKAENLFSQAIGAAGRASSYNNRAQLLRLKGNDEAAMDDLVKAIEISGGEGKSGCQAYNQMALLHRRYGRENDAKECFVRAAQLGSPFAKKQLVAMNPYAALCSHMLNEMMVKLNQLENGASEKAIQG